MRVKGLYTGYKGRTEPSRRLTLERLGWGEDLRVSTKITYHFGGSAAWLTARHEEGADPWVCN